MHTAFCVAVFTFAMVGLLINQSKLFFQSPNGYYERGFILTAIFSSTISNILFNSLIANIDSASDTKSKFIRYQRAFLTKCGILEAGSMVNLVVFLMHGNLYFLIFAGMPFINLVMSRPTASKVADTLSLQDTDIL